MRRLSAFVLIVGPAVPFIPPADPAWAMGTVDDDGNINEFAIDEIAAVGIMGCSPQPKISTALTTVSPVRRWRHPWFQTFDLPPSPTGHLSDTSSSIHRRDVDALADTFVFGDLLVSK